MSAVHTGRRSCKSSCCNRLVVPLIHLLDDRIYPSLSMHWSSHRAFMHQCLSPEEAGQPVSTSPEHSSLIPQASQLLIYICCHPPWSHHHALVEVFKVKSIIAPHAGNALGPTSGAGSMLQATPMQQVLSRMQAQAVAAISCCRARIPACCAAAVRSAAVLAAAVAAHRGWRAVHPCTAAAFSLLAASVCCYRFKLCSWHLK